MPFVHDIDPIALQIGPLAIRWYGLTYLAAGITAFMLGRKRAGEIWRGFRREEIEDIIFYGMIGVIVGGRLGSVFFYHFSDFLKDPLMLVRVWEGGMSFHGGLLGVLVAVGWYARKTGRAVFAIYDFVAPVVPIAWVPKSRVSVLPTQVTTGTTAALPRPVTDSIEGEPAALCAMVSVAR